MRQVGLAQRLAEPRELIGREGERPAAQAGARGGANAAAVVADRDHDVAVRHAPASLVAHQLTARRGSGAAAAAGEGDGEEQEHDRRAHTNYYAARARA